MKIRIAVASGKGGTGKTFVASSLFYSLLHQKEDVVLVDCDAEEPNASLFFELKQAKQSIVAQKVPVIDTDKCTYCGECHTYCNYNAVFILPPSKIIHIIEDLCHGCGACMMACKYDAITEKDVALGRVTNYITPENDMLIEARMKVGVYSPVPVIKSAIEESNNHTYVIMDAPPGTSCPFIQTAIRADFIILVVEPTPFGLSDLRQSVETLKSMHKAHGVIINKAGIGNNEVYDYLKDEGIPLLMEIPFDRDIAYEYAQGKVYAAKNEVLRVQLLTITKNIQKEYGVGHNKR